tara:strand:+ start:70 stop:465 length:396 start_codon:yes stop_codon:yes gene_type:complete
MPKFGRKSRERLATCDKRLQKLFNEIIKDIDCSVTEGHRTEERQNQMFKEKKSKARYPQSKHNSYPSRAVDVTPWPVDFEDRERQTLFAGYVLGRAQEMGINIRWGGDWDKDWETNDNKFDDFPHFELLDE